MLVSFRLKAPLPKPAYRGVGLLKSKSMREPTKQTPPLYRRRNPQESIVYQILRDHLETFLARLEEEERPFANWPGFVRRELAAFMDCGVLARGFCRFRCPSCGKDESVAFSCKGRGFCPSCGGRRMAEEAAHLVDHVLPEQPMRQWVLTVPHRVRYLIAFDRALCAQVRRIFVRAVETLLRKKARRSGVQAGRGGAVMFLQRFGGSVNLNLHFHALVLDGVYGPPSTATGLRFHPLGELRDHDVESLAWRIRDRVNRLLAKEGLLEEAGPSSKDPSPHDSPLLAGCYATSVQGGIGLGEKRGAYLPREGRIPGTRFTALYGDRCAEADGFTLHANVRIHGRDRKRLERLCRYMARPALASKRLELLSDGRLPYRPWPESRIKGRYVVKAI